ncbi:MlaD family protein [Allorhodopirellula heiligendammensis]|uniref:Mce related protein n=1 Tax=Allorhodopirellula heiligendammensis TaxID=2714739 RepID=A0A5C6BVV1_9BACT|nr:MlaD family protein [Allorhodopirellula heiligendammensis]TWU15757.1 mce related protein [Allorhodopirellula heiligendammensis]
MDDSRLRFGVGVLVIAAIGIGVILTFLFGAFPAILSREYILTVNFPSAQGINTNTPVLRDGVKIGRVSDIQLRSEGGVTLTLAMDEAYPMLHQYIPQIGIGSLITGDSKLEFRKAEPQELAALFPDDPAMIDRTYSNGEHLDYGQKLDDPFTLLFGMEDELRSTFSSIRHAGDAVQGTGESIQSLVNDVRGLIGIEPSSNAYPPGFPPQTSVLPRHSSMGIGNSAPMFAHASPGGQMPPAPSWAHPVRLVSASASENTGASTVQTAAFTQPNQNSLPPGELGADPARSLQPGLTPPVGTPRGGAGTPTFVQLQNEAIETLEELQGAIRDARSILGNEQIRRGIHDSVERFPGMLDQANETLRTAQKTFDNFAEVGKQFEQVGSVAEQAITELKTTAGGTLESFQATAQNVEAFTDPFGRRSEEFAEQVLRSLVSVDNALTQIDTFGKTINGSDGTLKRLIEDDEMYYEIKRTVENIEAATARIRPILDDVRVFTDKIARDPRQLGVRGALGHRPTGAGLK